jgi:hypothetical protein
MQKCTCSGDSGRTEQDARASSAAAAVAALQAQLASVQEQLTQSQLSQRAAEDRMKILQDDLLIERNERADREGIARQLQKAEQEKQQLQLVISQLRSSKRSTKEDVESIVAERDDLQEKLKSLTAAWTRDSQALSQALRHAEEEAVSTSGMHRALSMSQSNEVELRQRLQITEQQARESEKVVYELSVMVDTLQADLIICRQECERHATEASNLHAALRQQDQDREGAHIRVQQEAALLVNQAHAEHEQRLADVRRQLESQLHAEREELKVIRQRAEDESLLRRKAQLDLNAEKRSMQKTLENALSQIQNSQENVVDRQLIANLFVSYIHKGRPPEVLDLISRILGFNEEQLEVVGLRMPKVNFLSTFFDTLVGTDTDGDGDALRQQQQLQLQGGSLAELWVSFLEAEAGTGTGTGTAAVPQSTNVAAGVSSSTRADAAAGVPSTPTPTPTPTHANIKSPHGKLSGRPVPSIGAM